MKRNLKLSLLLSSIVFLLAPGHAALGMTVTNLTGVQMIDGNNDSTVSGVAFNVTLPGGFDFGYVTGSPGSTTFTPIAPTTSGSFGMGMGNWTFNAGDQVNFALHNNVFGTNYSIAEGYGTLDFAQEVTGSSTVNPNVTPYFNTLQIVWNSIPYLTLGVTFLDAGADFDGLAPVPIPTAALLFGTGLIGLIGIARRSLFVR